MSENLSPVKAETSSAEDDDSKSKSKSKKKALGSFLVEAKSPKTESDKIPTDETRTGLFARKRKPEAATPDPEALNTSEESEVISRLAAARRKEIAEGSGVDADIEEAEASAVAAFLEATESEGDIEAAYEQIVADIEFGNRQIDEQEPAHEVADLIVNTNVPIEGEVPLRVVQDAEIADTTATKISQTKPTSAAAGNANGGSQPPIPPRPTSSSGGSPPNGPANPPYQPPILNSPAVAPTSANLSSGNQLSRVERRAATDGLIVGAIVGYLYGRRRGRIKTEKRLLPVQRKLEKQVRGLQIELQAKETKVRQQAREQLLPTAVFARANSNKILDIRRNKNERVRTSVVVPERIGQVLVAASASGETIQSGKQPGSKLEVNDARRQAETMARTELLSLSEKIVVDGTSLRNIYETQLISEKGLRRLVAEHLRGGNLARALKRELIERQIDFERDPVLRDKSTRAAAGTAGQAAVKAVLGQNGKSSSDATRSDKKSSSQATKNQNSNATTKDSTSKSQLASVTDAALVTLIVVLAVAIVVLLLRA